MKANKIDFVKCFGIVFFSMFILFTAWASYNIIESKNVNKGYNEINSGMVMTDNEVKEILKE